MYIHGTRIGEVRDRKRERERERKTEEMRDESSQVRTGVQMINDLIHSEPVTEKKVLSCLETKVRFYSKVLFLSEARSCS